MNRVTLLAPAQRDLFGGFSGSLYELCSAVYDPEVTLFTEALESTGVPEAIAVAQQSYRLDGDMWRWNHKHKAESCQDYLARIEKAVT